MRIDFLGLQAFLSIADRGSFQKAAAHLNLSQTAISHRMRKLEDELGIKLFARTTRDVTLTRAGIEFLPKARKAFTELEQSLDELVQQGARRRERLDIACLPAFAVQYLPPILTRFHQTHPGVEVRIFETPSAAIADLVGSGDVEFGRIRRHRCRQGLQWRRTAFRRSAPRRPDGSGETASGSAAGTARRMPAGMRCRDARAGARPAAPVRPKIARAR